jgi:hypothetical protein
MPYWLLLLRLSDVADQPDGAEPNVVGVPPAPLLSAYPPSTTAVH